MAILNLSIGPRGPWVRVVLAPDPALEAARRAAGLPDARPHVGEGLLDTGAKMTLIDATIARRLDLEAVSQIVVNSATTGDRPVYGLELTIQAGAKSIAMPLFAVESDLSAFGVDVLIGRDFLARCLLVYNGPRGEFALSS